MKDTNGLYYYPNPSDNKTRVYVKSGTNGPLFRLWRADFPAVWEKHGWLDLQTIIAAASFYRENNIPSNPQTDPLRLYDVNVANALLKQENDNKQNL